MFCNIGPPTTLVFENQKCIDCGAYGDARLMPKFCHMKKVLVHRVQDAEKVHPGEKEPYHPNKVPIPVHPGYLHRPPWYKNIRLRKVYSCCGGAKTSAACARKWSCCKQTHKIVPKQTGLSTTTPLIPTNKPNDSNTSGCKKKYSCCGADVPDDPEADAPDGCEQLYSCCGRNRNQDGCREICLKCNEDWGTDAEKGRCFIKPHNITDLFPDGSKKSNIDSRSTDQDNIHVISERKRNDVKNKENRTFLEKCKLPDVIPMIPYPVL